MVVLTLNVCGIRASQKKGLFKWLSGAKADIICLQEVRATEEQIDTKEYSIKNYTRYLSEAIKKSFENKVNRVWVHTCSLDHKNALSNYISRGMKIFKTEILNI